MTRVDLTALDERLFRILTSSDFLGMKGLANEVPIFIAGAFFACGSAASRHSTALLKFSGM